MYGDTRTTTNPIYFARKEPPITLLATVSTSFASWAPGFNQHIKRGGDAQRVRWVPHTAQECRVCLTEKSLRDSSRCIERRNGLHLHELLVQTWSLPSSWSRSVRALSRSRGRSVAQAGGGENLLALKRYTWFPVGGGTGNWALSVFQTPECTSHPSTVMDIYILAGQSNMAGRGSRRTLPPRYQAVDNQGLFCSLDSASSITPLSTADTQSSLVHVISRGSPLSRAYKA